MGVFHNLAKTARYYRFVYHTEEGRIAQAMVDLQDAVILLSSLDHGTHSSAEVAIGFSSKTW
jgi:hypothetical protein